MPITTVDAAGTAVTAVGQRINTATVLIVNAWTQHTANRSQNALEPARYTPGRETASATTATTIVVAAGIVEIVVSYKQKKGRNQGRNQSNTGTAINVPVVTRTSRSAEDVVAPTSPSKATAIATMATTTARAIGMVATVARLALWRPGPKNTAIFASVPTRTIKK